MLYQMDEGTKGRNLQRGVLEGSEGPCKKASSTIEDRSPTSVGGPGRKSAEDGKRVDKPGKMASFAFCRAGPEKKHGEIINLLS